LSNKADNDGFDERAAGLVEVVIKREQLIKVIGGDCQISLN